LRVVSASALEATTANLGRGCEREPRPESTSVAGQLVVGVGVVDAGRADLAELLALARNGIGKVDDPQDLGPPKRVICTARMQVGLGVLIRDVGRGRVTTRSD
jgi:hypothetical protein